MKPRRDRSPATGACRPSTAAVATAALFVMGVSCIGCAKRIGEQAAAGAIQTLQAERNAGQAPLRTAGANATTGVIDALDSPEQQARLRAMITEMSRAAAAAAVGGATSRLMQQMGSDGGGRLTDGVTNAAALASTAAVAAAGAELPEALTGCRGPDARACLERELNALARSTATGFTAGIRDTIGWPIVVFAFLLGMAAGVFTAWAWSLRGRRRWLRTA
ncbi:MAG TPA: hypothetical protein VHO67_18355 [Polyangia bacterium]|nr:hypothetical protein [Polyangia bacterium]